MASFLHKDCGNLSLLSSCLRTLSMIYHLLFTVALFILWSNTHIDPESIYWLAYIDFLILYHEQPRHISIPRYLGSDASPTFDSLSVFERGGKSDAHWIAFERPRAESNFLSISVIFSSFVGCVLQIAGAGRFSPFWSRYQSFPKKNPLKVDGLGRPWEETKCLVWL